MRNCAAWVAAAVAAAGCGGKTVDVAKSGADERLGPGAVCAECKVTGGGQIEIGDRRFQFAVQAIPESGAHAGPGFGGVGVAAKGQVVVHDLAREEVKVAVPVDTILGCRRENGRLTATFAGSAGEAGRFEVVAVDGGEPEDDLLSFEALFASSTIAIARGNVQVHELDRCGAECGEGECEPECSPGECACPEEREVCEPCDGHDGHEDPAAAAPGGAGTGGTGAGGTGTGGADAGGTGTGGADAGGTGTGGTDTGGTGTGGTGTGGADTGGTGTGGTDTGGTGTGGTGGFVPM